jgi:hypothetical protein
LRAQHIHDDAATRSSRQVVHAHREPVMFG